MQLTLEAVDATRAHMMCDCGGKYKATASRKTQAGAGPREYKHRCDKCDDTVWLEQEYPKIYYTTRTHMPLTTEMLGTSLFK